MKNPYISSLYPEIPGPPFPEAAEYLKRSGNNLGNFMFCSAVRRVVQTTTHPRGDFRRIDLKTVARECDGIIIAAANWLQPKQNYGGLADQIEKANVPAVITGIGAQSSGGKIPELLPGMLRLLQVVSERSHSISVRGPFSAEVLNHYGIKNVTVTGCPSLLWHMTHPAAVTRLPEPGKVGRVTLNGTLHRFDIPKSPGKVVKLTRLTMQLAESMGCDYVVQNELPFLRAHLGEVSEEDQETWDFLQFIFGSQDRAAITAYLERHIRGFPNIPEWLAYCANHDLVLGSRLHGVIAGLLAGTPSVLITHDSRTEEMGRFAGIPTITAEEFMARGRIDPDAILADADFDAFNARQKDYFRDFAAYFDANDVPHNLRPDP